MTTPLPLIRDDAHLPAVDKPAGLPVHRAGLDAHEPDDLMTRLRAQRGAAPWPAHRCHTRPGVERTSTRAAARPPDS